ncbi:Response regulator receiver domain-containing protein [Fibrobacter sp. UWR3]|uniref:response regulator n=1 Tax=Fibrobacter sp. UWR3 TaxID=1896217 RepID=UPI000912A9F2|nr:response regulator [Fibrobacter sp. UWR3]SHM18421.1 Response regulator receiver domain-containing protein [Fibrobacter sp. UWR3]
MNNQFKILWIEDNDDWYKAASRKVIEFIESHSLSTNCVERKKTGKNLNLDSLKSNNYDLILMDYKLPKGSPNGDKIIENIRKNLILTDILFYSSQYDEMIESFREMVPEIDGVYLSKRDRSLFLEKVDRLISKIVQRSEDIVNLRGMVLEATSDFEEQAEKLLTKLYDSAKERKKQILDSILDKKILQHNQKEIKQKVADFEDGKLNVSIANNDFLGMYNRLTIFAEYAKTTNNKEAKNILNYYMSKLGYFRNKLGHVKNGDVVKVAGKEYTINQDFHRMMRKNINELEEGFQNKINFLLNDGI